MDNEIVVVPESDVMLGAIPMKPKEVIQRASEIATELAKIVNDRQLFKIISGRKYVQVEGWNTLGAMLGVLPVERETKKIENGYEAFVDLIRTSDGLKVGGASAICTTDERNWSSRDEYAVRSMAITRATGKAFRLGFSWIMQLAGYETTPAEEIPHEEPKVEKKAPSSGRPYPPDVLKERIVAKAKDFRNQIADGKRRGCTDADRKICASAIGTFFNGETTPRYELCKWLVGESSTKKMPGEYILALLAWMEVANFDDLPSDVSKREAIPAHAAALEAAGQMRLGESQ